MRVIISGPARSDITEIYEYLTKEAGIRKARAIIADIRERCTGLQKMPQRYQFLPGFEKVNYRRRVYRDYLIIYEVTANRVNIIRVLHGASDIEKLLIDLT